ncbi:MAG: hypothetical protein JWQ09_210 [Segetibacter sp.]|nr:hypothetical protein [Segetibacter sp.]
MTTVLYGNPIMCFSDQAALDDYLGVTNQNKNSVILNSLFCVVLIVFITAGVLYMIQTRENSLKEKSVPDYGKGL